MFPELVVNFGEGSESASKEIYELLYKSLNRISVSDTKKAALIAVIKFQLKLLLVMGFAWNWILVFVVENRFWMKTCTFLPLWEELYVKNAMKH